MFWITVTDEAECSKKIVSGGKVAGAISPLINARGLQFECAKILYESLVIHILMYTVVVRQCYGRRRRGL